MPQIHVAENGVFIFRFDTEEDMLHVYGGGPWMVKGVHPLILKQWSPGTSLDPCSLVNFPVWIKLPNLDLQFWSPSMLGKIASHIGKPCYIDKLTANRERIAYARVLVELQSGETMLDQIVLKGPDNKEFTQRIVYESRPLQCYQCLKFGHSVRNCRSVPHQAWVPTGGTCPIMHTSPNSIVAEGVQGGTVSTKDTTIGSVMEKGTGATSVAERRSPQSSIEKNSLITNSYMSSGKGFGDRTDMNIDGLLFGDLRTTDLEESRMEATNQVDALHVVQNWTVVMMMI